MDSFVRRQPSFGAAKPRMGTGPAAPGPWGFARRSDRSMLVSGPSGLRCVSLPTDPERGSAAPGPARGAGAPAAGPPPNPRDAGPAQRRSVRPSAQTQARRVRCSTEKSASSSAKRWPRTRLLPRLRPRRTRLLPRLLPRRTRLLPRLLPRRSDTRDCEGTLRPLEEAPRPAELSVTAPVRSLVPTSRGAGLEALFAICQRRLPPAESRPGPPVHPAPTCRPGPSGGDRGHPGRLGVCPQGGGDGESSVTPHQVTPTMPSTDPST